ncbi:PucR family transcriptional regulator [Actinomadura kijaniata]|uniref:PucR family transcriptional regulator n=1 Tax=Actinomadura kijaniata TaxID=46161 RepID=UPI00082AEF49|nr:helix-turn-helix domain-containing protein [Actinomadura kijaniata]
MRTLVQDLLDLRELRGATLAGGTRGLSAPVAEIVLVQPDDVLSAAIPAESGVVFSTDGGRTHMRCGHLVDVLLRRAHAARARALIVCGGPASPAATRRLADRLNLPLVQAHNRTPLELATALRTAVLGPRLVQSETLLELNRLLRSARRSPDRMLAALGTVLDASVSACNAQGTLVAGTPPITSVEEIIGVRGITTLVGERAVAAVLPVLGPAGTTSLWVAAERSVEEQRGGPRWRETAERALALAHGELSAWLVRERLRSERDARLRGTLLTEILDHGDALPAHIADQAMMIGWRLDGWHSGVHITVAGAADSASVHSEMLVDAIGRAGLDIGPFVQRADGWSAWLTTPKAPLPAQTATVRKALEVGLAELGRRPYRLRLAAGIGSPARDAGGIASTLAEARQAAVAASTEGGPGAVRRVEELGAARILLGWYGSRAFADYARQLLAPLLASGEKEVLATVESYIDHACSAGTTARALGLHRNTVAQRIRRAERLLGLPLTHAETRLAIQLACRVLRSTPDPIDL